MDDELWSLLQSQSSPLWALRTVAGALGEPGRLEQHRQKNSTDPNIPIAQRVTAIAAKFAAPDWTDFCLRYAASIPSLRTTIGGTANPTHLNHFLTLAMNAKPLPTGVIAEIDASRKQP